MRINSMPLAASLFWCYPDGSQPWQRPSILKTGVNEEGKYFPERILKPIDND
ncbi:MAG: hypothetical protein IH594_00535 [Bacteroidales bacterium]|nr:hypothetical protein [Bacteroidales bacterium]